MEAKFLTLAICHKETLSLETFPPNFGNGEIPEFPSFGDGFNTQMENMPKIGNIPEQDRRVPEGENFQNIPF